MPAIEIVDPNNVGTTGRGSAGRYLRARGYAQTDGDTAVLAVTITDQNGNPASVGGGTVTFPSATSSRAVSGGAGPAAAKSTSGVLYAVVISASGTSPLTITDGPSGPVIAVVPANQPPGDLPMYGGGRPFSTSLYVNSGANTPAVTLIYA